MINEVPKIDVSPLKFQYRLSAWDCYRLRTGRCSLERPLTEADTDEWVTHDEGAFDYCRRLYLYMKNNSMNAIQISARSCGHYSFSDGQHRACIAKRMKLPIPVNFLSGAEIICNHCYQKEISLKYKVKSKLFTGRIFTDDEPLGIITRIKLIRKHNKEEKSIRHKG